MVELKKRSECDTYLEDAKWNDGFFGGIWERSLGDIERLMLVKYFRASESTLSDDKTLYGWHDKNMCFFHIGKFIKFDKAMNEVQTVYRFDTLKELAAWMES